MTLKSQENIKNSIKIGIIQIKADSNKGNNLDKISKYISELCMDNVGVVALPEMFNYLGEPETFSRAAENIPGETSKFISKIAERKDIFILAGSILEKNSQNKKPYNTSFLIDPSGKIIAKYRKIHLFEINFQNNTNYDESDFLSPGNELSYNNILGIKAGMTICYDLRFPEIFRALTSIGCKIIFVPSSFEEETGKSHWETLLRTRAIENQVYIVAPNQTGFTKNTLTKKWGHSLIINPWGEILCTIEKGEGCASAVIDIKFLEKVRKKVPVLKYLKKHGSI